jgi:chemotaxis protein MotB
MARKAAWQDTDADLGPYRRSGSSFGRVFVGLLVVGTATFVAAYYLPLYRAQQTLSAQYRELTQKLETAAQSVSQLQTELKTTTAQRDTLQAEHDQHASSKKSDTDKLDRVRGELSSKLDKFLKKGNAAVTTTGNSLLVALDDNLLFGAQKLELSAQGRALLCDIGTASGTFSIRASSSMAQDGAVPAALSANYASPWALTAARAAAVTQTLEEKCSFPAARMTATGNGKTDPFAALLASATVPAERVEIEITSAR